MGGRELLAAGGGGGCNIFSLLTLGIPFPNSSSSSSQLLLHWVSPRRRGSTGERRAELQLLELLAAVGGRGGAALLSPLLTPCIPNTSLFSLSLSLSLSLLLDLTFDRPLGDELLPVDPENSAVPAAAVHGLLSAANHSMINDNHYWMNDITYTGTYTNGTPAAFRVWSQSQLDFMYLDPDFPALSFPSDYDSDSYVNTGIRTEFAIGGHGRKRKRQSHSPPPRLVRFRNIHHQTGLCRVVDRGADGNCYPFVVQAHIAAARARGEGTPTTDEIRAAGVDQIRRWVNGAVAMDVTTELMLKELLSATSADFNAWCKRVRCGSLSVSLSFSLQLLFPLLLFSALSHSAQLTHSHTPAAFFFFVFFCTDAQRS